MKIAQLPVILSIGGLALHLISCSGPPSSANFEGHIIPPLPRQQLVPDTPSTPRGGVSAAEARQVVALHNRARAEVGVPPLQYNEQLAGYAQAWADHLASAGQGMEHRPASGPWKQLYGENLYMASANGSYGVNTAVNLWLREKSNYDGTPLKAATFHHAGHYTEMVWRGTTHVGCGKAIVNGQMIIVCNYSPAGNMIGERPY